ncbi:YqaE/Pmp3 family membrane protein [Halomonas alimentaria]|uniref:YqaE/Pmp3 family membrane protein n=1 Tax=Halomonas alimentaria TaxID=147248 RepID=A0A7X5ARP0_9GAMM|nr:YqaE/Pmp3 family membrane protein [Halomonas alimentaria]NAW35286.1 YqaE/Pmp3 family membrane protein [Halomonas alimentaria]
MDAREYLARQGIDGERDRERPNTLEEKAWARAREAGDHRPRAGTPYDWEEWERYHDDLAEGAESITQKIDREAHRRALDHDSAPRDDATVRSHVPSRGREVGDSGTLPPLPDQAPAEPPRVRLAFRMLAILLPPLALGLAGQSPRRVLVAVALTLLGWIPGVVYAWRRLSSP